MPTLSDFMNLALGQRPGVWGEQVPSIPNGDINGGNGGTPMADPSSGGGSWVDHLNRMLAPYGQQTQDYQNIMLPEPGTPGFFGQHPMVSRMIENALLAGATTQGGETAGQSISNVAGSVLGLGRNRHELLEERTMRPFGEVAKLAPFINMQQQAQLAQANIADKQADAAWKNAHAASIGIDNKRHYWNGDRFAVKDKDGKYYYAQRDAITGESDWIKDPNGQKMEAAPKDIVSARGGSATAIPGYWGNFAKTEPERQAALASYNQELQGGQPFSPDEYAKFSKNYKIQTGAAGAGANTNARKTAEQNFEFTPEEQKIAEGYKQELGNNQLRVADDKARKAYRSILVQNSKYNPSTFDSDWQNHVTQNNAQAQKTYEDKINNLRNQSSMGRGNPMKPGRPNVDIKPDGTIRIR